MAELAVTRRSNGEKVKLCLRRVDRQSGQVTIDIPGYNSSFTFTCGPKFAVLIPEGRRVIDPTQPAIDHVSETVYHAMAKWAFSILTAPRRVL